MNNAGVFSLCEFTPTVAITAQAQSPIVDLGGMASVTLEAGFQYGTGGTTCSVTVQTSFDGTMWRDIARFDFGTSAATKHCCLVSQAKGIAVWSALSAEGVHNGILGNQLRAVVTSTGTYANTTLSVWASAR